MNIQTIELERYLSSTGPPTTLEIYYTLIPEELELGSVFEKLCIDIVSIQIDGQDVSTLPIIQMWWDSLEDEILEYYKEESYA